MSSTLTPPSPPAQPNIDQHPQRGSVSVNSNSFTYTLTDLFGEYTDTLQYVIPRPDGRKARVSVRIQIDDVLEIQERLCEAGRAPEYYEAKARAAQAAAVN